jgi:ATP-dependent DNA helicase RecG
MVGLGMAEKKQRNGYAEVLRVIDPYEESILAMLGLGEGQPVEFKSSARDVNALGRIICGFLNTTGGYLVCGIDPKYTISGIEAASDLVAPMEKKIHQYLSPKTLVSVQTQAIDDKTLIVIAIPAGKDVPYAWRDVIYIREDEVPVKADAETIRDIVMRHQIEPERWERRFSFANLERDLDLVEIRATVAAAQGVRRAFFRDTNAPLSVLEDLSVAKYGRLTNGGDVLFGTNVAARLPQVRVRAACYPQDKRSDAFIDMKAFDGPLIPVLEQCFEFIIRNTATMASFAEHALRRKDSYTYPEHAVREALVNAFAHRDYANSAGGITIGVYPNRLEISNAGTLLEGITPAQLATGRLSILRNPDIAHVLYLRGQMEKLGRGGALILSACREHGLPKPVWTSEAGQGVSLTLFAKKAGSRQLGGNQFEGKIRNVIGPPVEAENFFGRNLELEELQNLLDHGDDILLTGPRRIGKTSLARMLMRQQAKKNWQTIELNVAGVSSEFNFISVLLMRIANLEVSPTSKASIHSLQSVLDSIPQNAAVIDGIHLPIPTIQRSIALAMEGIFSELHRDKILLLITIDELAVFLKSLENQANGAERVRQFLFWLKSIRASHNRAIHWFFVAESSLDSFLLQYEIENAISDLRRFRLDPFSDDEAENFLAALAASNKLEISPQIRKTILQRSGSFAPFYLQLLFAALKAIRKSNIDDAAVAAAFGSLEQPGRLTAEELALIGVGSK